MRHHVGRRHDGHHIHLEYGRPGIHSEGTRRTGSSTSGTGVLASHVWHSTTTDPRVRGGAEKNARRPVFAGRCRTDAGFWLNSAALPFSSDTALLRHGAPAPPPAGGRRRRPPTLARGRGPNSRARAPRP